MLLNLREYHRPALEAADRPLAHALDLLARPHIRTVPLAGGAALLASADRTVEAVVDLQGMGLDGIAEDTTGALHIGAMVTRAALADHQAVRALCSGIVAEGARRWGGSVQRNRATVGGAVAVAAANDPLLVALLACAARVILYDRAGRHEWPLAGFLARRAELLAAPGLITEIRVGQPAAPHGAALVHVARTPADAPIVVAAAYLERAGETCRAARLAFGGVAGQPLAASEAAAALVGRPMTAAAIAEVAAAAAASLQPPADFRGSAEYRRAMAEVLAGRALRLAWERAA